MHSADDICVNGFWFVANQPPSSGEERLDEWIANLEAIPAEQAPVEPILNVSQATWAREDH